MLILAAAGALAHGADAPPPAGAPAADGAKAPVNSAGLVQGPYSDAVAAVVNGHIITMAELVKQCKPTLDLIHTRLLAKYPPTDEGMQAASADFKRQADELGADVLRSLVDRELVVEEFTTKGYQFPPSYLDWQFDDSMTTRFHGDRNEYLRYLTANDQTDEDFRNQLKQDDMVSAMRQQVHDSVTGISPVRIKNFYEQHKADFAVKESVKLRQITLSLAPVADVTPDLVLQQAAKIVQEARQPGANFNDLAKRYSNDPAARNGDVQDFTYERNTMAPPLEAVAFKLQPGGVSDPIVNDKTVFIFKCDDHIDAGYLPLDKVRSQIEDKLANDDEQQAWEAWLQKLRDKAYILYYIYGPAKDSAAPGANATKQAAN